MFDKEYDVIVVGGGHAGAEATAADPKAAENMKVNPTPVAQQEVDIQPMTPAEMKEMIARAKEGQADDDCLMCGS